MSQCFIWFSFIWFLVGLSIVIIFAIFNLCQYCPYFFRQKNEANRSEKDNRITYWRKEKTIFGRYLKKVIAQCLKKFFFCSVTTITYSMKYPIFCTKFVIRHADKRISCGQFGLSTIYHWDVFVKLFNDQIKLILITYDGFTKHCFSILRLHNKGTYVYLMYDEVTFTDEFTEIFP